MMDRTQGPDGGVGILRLKYYDQKRLLPHGVDLVQMIRSQPSFKKKCIIGYLTHKTIPRPQTQDGEVSC